MLYILLVFIEVEERLVILIRRRLPGPAASGGSLCTYSDAVTIIDS